MGQVYGEVKLNDHVVFDLFRKAYDTPYINQRDNRMVPNTFEAYTARATIGGKDGAPEFRCGGGYFTRMKGRDSSQFVPMSVAAGVNNRDRGVAVGGAALETKQYSLGAINYYSQDIINIFYAEGKYTLPHKSGLGFQLAAQFTDQENTGSNLLYGRPFSTRQVGLRGNLSYQGAMLTLAYTNNAIGGANMFESWGSYPGYTSVQYSDFNHAGERAFMIQGTYNFKHLGLTGVTFYALWVHGWNWVNPTGSRFPRRTNSTSTCSGSPRLPLWKASGSGYATPITGSGKAATRPWTNCASSSTTISRSFDPDTRKPLGRRFRSLWLVVLAPNRKSPSIHIYSSTIGFFQ